MHTLLARFPPSVVALVLQLIAFLLALLGMSIANFSPDPLSFALLCGFTAAILSHLAGLARWWLLIQLLFVPTLVLMLKLNVPSGVYLAAFLVMLAVYWSTFRSQVPLYLSSKRVWKTLEELLPSSASGKRFNFMDIGSGMGGVLTHLSTERPDGNFYGVENAPLPYLLSRLRIRLGNHANCHVQWGSLWTCNLAPYDVVFAYLSPVPMEQLWRKVKQEMRPGTLFISNSFAVPESPPQYSISLDDLHHSTLHIWHM
ncbi:MAG: hypothetical protein B7Y56_05380 [Gallionellales bacterium 35-53-114]|nr:MAG: hypothetical protein B7Y56_05380 [Gallionellales bacterium 35-53-114]OYZ62568.1 MAG: hypothetical protein B7Y04_11830 [Gallionellales bacterium 24-53-125]OZB09527.1 MAG: hypothetical protein B7X61_07720 [Gallionellales bacterium 39-52-133]HQS57806.1 class I SAM-dependent methyltransferase [Gallionellaceae bacterium]HQS74259.1 class I SAM-dependent methyltransferase [Gallionellaceae bacterium]